MAKKSSEQMAKEIINTESYALEGKVVKVTSDGNRTVYQDVMKLRGKFTGGIELTVDGKTEVMQYSESDKINNISCKA